MLVVKSKCNKQIISVLNSFQYHVKEVEDYLLIDNLEDYQVNFCLSLLKKFNVEIYMTYKLKTQ